MKKVLVLIILMSSVLIGCGGVSNQRKSSDVLQQEQTKQVLKEANNQIGMPAIVNFQEKKLMKQIYELRDQENLICFAYYLDMNGGKHFLGKCIGYGIPYSTQFSNPLKIWDLETDGGAKNKYEDNGEIQLMPQAEPNGLFMPEGLSATWLLLLDEKGEPHPIYIESEIIVSPIKLK